MTLTLEIPLPPKGCSPNEASSRTWQVRATATEWHRDQVKTIAAVAKPADWVHQPVRISTVWYMAPTEEELAIKAADKAGEIAGKGRRKGRVPGVSRSWAVKMRPMDTGNAYGGLKAAIDGLVDALIVPKDDRHWVAMDSPKLLRTAKEHKGRACIVMTIEQVEGLF